MTHDTITGEFYAHNIFPILKLRVFSKSIFKGKLMEKKFYDLSATKLLANFRYFDIFRKV